MTVTQMHQEFKVKMDRMDASSLPDFEPEEIDILLNTAYNKFIEERYNGLNLMGTGFEESQKRMDDLDALVTTATITSFVTNASNKPNAQYVVIPDGTTVTDPISNTPYPKYKHAIQEEAIISFTDSCTAQSTTKRVPVIPTTHDRYNKAIANPFKKPSQDKIWRLSVGFSQVNNTTRVFELVRATGTTLTTYILRYLKEPKAISIISNPVQNCELRDHTHTEIVDIAVKIAIENIESNRTRTIEVINRPD